MHQHLPSLPPACANLAGRYRIVAGPEYNFPGSDDGDTAVSPRAQAPIAFLAITLR
jgi:hypothetical protein